MSRITGVRVLVVCDRQILLVEHDQPVHGRFWVLPGGGREPGETLAAAARREVREETGVELTMLHRVAVPRSVRWARQARARRGASPSRAGSTYALFAGETSSASRAWPQVDLSTESFLRGAAWHPVSMEQPLGPLDARYWSHLAPLIRERL